MTEDPTLIDNGVSAPILMPSPSLAAGNFYQELQYDLSESNRITFRDFVFEVLEATNEKIRFKVLSDGSAR